MRKQLLRAKVEVCMYVHTCVCLCVYVCMYLLGTRTRIRKSKGISKVAKGRMTKGYSNKQQGNVF